MTASGELDAALRIVPSLADHARIPASLPLDPGLDAASVLLDRAISLDPTLGAAHAARGNLLLRRGQTAAAVRAYELAARLDPYDAPSRLVLAELASMAGAADAGERFAAVFALARVYSPPPWAGARSALALMLAGPWHRNTPLDFIVDARRWNVHRLYLHDGADPFAERVPEYDLVIDALGESVDAHAAIATASAFLAKQTKPFVNDPSRLRGTSRVALATTLANVPNCVVPAVARVAQEDLTDGIGGPIVIRPTDTHGGRSFERIDDAEALAAYRERVASETYDVAPFVDYRLPDGYYRKYRVMFVDGVPYPYHLAIDTAWMIHYHRAPMAEHAWMREEEIRFLTAPAAAFPGWDTTLPAIAGAVGLDYFGIDCARLPDGNVLVFEADAAMLVHDFDPAPHKRAAVAAIRTAFAALLERRAGPQPFAIRS